MPFDDGVGVAGFSLHAGVAARSDERKKLERLCRYISRPTIAEKCLSLTPNGNVRYQLKTPYRDGTTHVTFEPLDFIARLATLVPKPRGNLTRLHGVFAPNSNHRARVTLAQLGRGGRHRYRDLLGLRRGGAGHRVYRGPDVIEKILTHLDTKAAEPQAPRRPPCRAPPQRGLFD